MITMNISLNKVSTAERTQSDRFGQTLPLVGTSHQCPAAPFDGGNAF